MKYRNINNLNNSNFNHLKNEMGSTHAHIIRVLIPHKI